MANPVLGRFSYPTSLRQLTRGRGWNSELVGFLLPFARQDFLYIEDDFTYDTLNAVLWDLAVTAGGAPTTFAIPGTHLENGAISGATGTTDNGVCAVKYAGNIFDAARNPGCEIRFKSDAVTGFSFEWGFTDPLTDEALPAVTDVDTPATGNGATDLVVVHMDTDQTLTTMALVTDGTTDAAAKTNLGTLVPTAATYMRILVQAFANKGFAVVDNDFVNGAASVDTGMDTAVLVRPHALFRTRNTTTKNVDIDYMRIWAERN